MSVLTVVSSRGRQVTAMQASAIAPKITTAGMVPPAVVKIEPNRICWVAPVVAPSGGVKVEEQGGQADGSAEYDAGRQVPSAHPPDADRVHHPGPDDA